MKKLLIIFLLIPTLALSGIFKDEEGKFGLKTKVHITNKTKSKLGIKLENGSVF